MQKSFSDLEYAAKKKLTRRDRFHAKIDEVTPWSQLHQLLATLVSTSISRRPQHRGSNRRWFATLTEKQIRRGTHRSTRQLEDAIRSYLKMNNAEPKPFVWTKSADAILASIERLFLRISNSGH